MDLQEKYNGLLNGLKGLGRLAVAFSAGVDSTFLLACAQMALGGQVVAITVRSDFFPQEELAEAEAYCRERGIQHSILPFDPLADPALAKNPPERCYLCKRMLFQQILAEGEKLGFYTVADGSNMDDLQDYRPGRRALEELGILSPLREAGLTKADIRALSKSLCLKTWDKPAFACLASRFPYGEPITRERLAQVGAAEEFLRAMGFAQLRVRAHGGIARIEVPPEDIPRLAALEARQTVIKRLRQLGFLYVTLDLEGYKMGSMNRELERN